PEISRIAAAYERMWRALGHPKPQWPLGTEPAYDGGYHVEFQGDSYRWIASERGVYLDLQETRREEDILEWIAGDFTRTLAHNEVFSGKSDGRPDAERHRQANRRQVEMLAILDPAWSERKAAQFRQNKLL